MITQEKAGEPQGAIFGFSGETKADVNDYYDPDGTLRNPQEIYNLWKGQGIQETDKIALQLRYWMEKRSSMVYDSTYRPR